MEEWLNLLSYAVMILIEDGGKRRRSGLQVVYA